MLYQTVSVAGVALPKALGFAETAQLAQVKASYAGTVRRVEGTFFVSH